MKTLEDQLARYGELQDERFGPIGLGEITDPTVAAKAGKARSPIALRHPVGLVVASMLAVVVVVGGIALLQRGTTGSTGGILGAVVTIEPSDVELLKFRPGPIEVGGDPWLTHTVTVDVATDAYVQTVTLADRYVVDGSNLVPAPGSVETEHIISDETTPGETSFVVEGGQLSEGEHSYTLAVPVHFEPKPEHADQFSPGDVTLEVVFSYDVFRAESVLAVWCVRADQLLWGDADFSPEAFAEEGEGILTPEQVAAFEQAAVEFNEEAETNLHQDPSRFFDLVEEICDVSYQERWEGWA